MGTANLQEANGRSRIESGIARMTNADARQARRFPLFHLKIGRSQTQFTGGGASGLPVGPPLHSQTRVFASRNQELRPRHRVEAQSR
jgi:hypothetical protein